MKNQLKKLNHNGNEYEGAINCALNFVLAYQSYRLLVV
jgi:hypothetical protein